jgi:hypothetical protein
MLCSGKEATFRNHIGGAICRKCPEKGKQEKKTGGCLGWGWEETWINSKCE